MSTKFDDRILKISNPTFDKVGCFATTNKIIFTRDCDSNGNIKVNSLVLSDLFSLGHSQIKDYSILSIDNLFSEIKDKGYIIVSKFNNTQIQSLFGKPIVVTIIKNNELYELICNRLVQVRGDELKLYLNNSVNPVTGESYQFLNKKELERMGKTEYLEEIPKKHYWDSVTFLCYYVELSIKDVYSIESIGKTIIEDREFTEFGEIFWTPDNIVFESLNLVIDYDKKMISGSYSDTFEATGGRRTSNGWEDKYISQYSFFYKSFELIASMNSYINDLYTRFTDLDVMVEIGNYEIDASHSSLKKHIVIKFSKPILFKEINKILGFDISGSTYNYYV